MTLYYSTWHYFFLGINEYIHLEFTAMFHISLYSTKQGRLKSQQMSEMLMRLPDTDLHLKLSRFRTFLPRLLKIKLMAISVLRAISNDVDDTKRILYTLLDVSSILEIGLLHLKSLHPPCVRFWKSAPQGSVNIHTFWMIFRLGQSQRE